MEDDNVDFLLVYILQRSYNIMLEKKGRISAQGLDENVVESFREFVIERYGKLHTVFGQEIQKALVSYLDENATHTHKDKSERKSFQKSGSKKKIELAEEQIEAAGLLAAINNGGNVRSNAIKTVLKGVVGIDPRTLDNHFNAFLSRHNLIVDLNDGIAMI